MKSKHYTILVVPERTKEVRQLKIPKLLVRGGVTFVVALIIFSVFITVNYIKNKNSLSWYQENERINLAKADPIRNVTVRVEAIKKKVEDIEKLNNQLRIIANLETPDIDNSALGVGGPLTEEMTEDLSSLTSSEAGAIKQLHNDIDKLQTKTAFEKESLLDLINFLDTQESFLASTPSVWPTRGVKTSGFGGRISPFTKQKSKHKGVDIAARKGTPVIAPADGIVKVARRESHYGNLIVIEHGYGYETRFAHLDAFLVEPGQKVRRGDRIGLVGNTGRSTGSHLHYEVRVDSVPKNPLKYVLN